MNPFIHCFTHPPTHPSIHSPIDPSLPPSIHPSTKCIQSSIHSYIHLSIMVGDSPDELSWTSPPPHPQPLILQILQMSNEATVSCTFHFSTMCLLAESRHLLFVIYGMDAITILLLVVIISTNHLYNTGQHIIIAIHNANFLLCVFSTAYFIFRVGITICILLLFHSFSTRKVSRMLSWEWSMLCRSFRVACLYLRLSNQHIRLQQVSAHSWLGQ